MELHNRLGPAPTGLSNYNLRDSKPVMKFNFYEKRLVEKHVHGDIEIIYLIEGDMNVIVDKMRFRLCKDAFLLINSWSLHSLTANSDVIYAVFHIDYRILSYLLGGVPLAFDINTSQSESSESNYIRDLLKKIMLRHKNLEGGNILYSESLHYLLLDSLVQNFFVEPTGERSVHSENKLKIENFIQLHYNEPMSLEQLANLLHISAAYVSKYFKRLLGVNFYEYLTDVRLENSLKELQESSHSISRIAMDTGFANSSSFANAFKKKYRLNPSDYAEEYKKSLSPDDSSAFNAKNLSLRKAGYNEALSARAVKLLVGEGGQPALLKHPETIEIRVDAAKYQPHHKKTIRLINIGRANLLTDFDMRGQLLDMKTNLGIEYVRFWDIYDLFPCFDEYAGHTSGQYYFSKLDRVFDFLTENALHPFIELGFKPQILLRLKDGGHQYILTKPKDILFKTASEYEKFMRLFVEHFVNRYGAEELGKWYFEQWIDPREKSGDDLTNFFEVFEAAYRGIKGVSPNSCVGGGGISHGYDNYPAYFKAWHERAIHPDYISIYCYPYTAVLSGKEPVSINTQLNELKAAAFEGIPFIITEWSYAVSDRNPFNDTSFKASYMIHTLLSDILGDEMVGYWHGADLLSEYNDIDQILHGGNGLVSIDGIRKPAYYALYFINKLGEYMLYNGNDCRITTNGRKNFSILCCNYKPLNSDYFIKSEDDIKIDEMAGFYDNMQDKSLHITIENAANGIYKIKTHSINENHGSVYSEWKKLSYLKNVSKEEIDYLKSVCHPEITVQITEVTNNRLEFAASLTAQEMQYIHITLQ